MKSKKVNESSGTKRDLRGESGEKREDRFERGEDHISVVVSADPAAVATRERIDRERRKGMVWHVRWIPGRGTTNSASCQRVEWEKWGIDRDQRIRNVEVCFLAAGFHHQWQEEVENPQSARLSDPLKVSAFFLVREFH